MTLRPFIALLLVPVLGVMSASGQSTDRNSPFLPPPDAPAAAQGVAAPAGAQELTGVIQAGTSVLINLTEAQARRSYWVGVGKTVNGVEVVSYDTKSETAVIRVGGETRSLKLRQPTVAASSGQAFATVPVAPPVPLPPPSSPKEAEREARMLVSDLLEIGIQQRKAYEEAQKKAAAEAARKEAAAAKR